MLANSFSIALFICMAATLFLIGLASITGIKILLFWNAESDSERQIELEGRTWLAAALVETGLAVQILSLILLVLAAGEYSAMIAGAMCATGSFLANEFGPSSLYIKIIGAFIYGFWIVLHRLDLQSEKYPLIKIKFIYLQLLLPYLVLDSYYLFQYLYNLKPDIITSCCGVIFSDSLLRTNFLMVPISSELIVGAFYITAFLLALAGFALSRRECIKRKPNIALHLGFGIGYSLFFLLSLLSITLFFSSYIYAMPNHNCPFDLLHAEYNFIGFPLYFCLFVSCFLAISASATALFYNYPGLSGAIRAYQHFAIRTATFLLLIFITLVTLPTVVYLLAGGEV